MVSITDEPLLVSERFIDNAGAARYRRRDVFPEYHVINVDRFNKIDEEDLEMLDQWIYLFKQSEVRGDFDAPGMETARERLAYLKMDQDQRKAYDRHMDNFVRELDIMETAHNDGREEGRKEGRKEGRVEEREDIIVAMDQQGLSVEQISSCTKLTPAEVKGIIEKSKSKSEGS